MPVVSKYWPSGGTSSPYDGVGLDFPTRVSAADGQYASTSAHAGQRRTTLYGGWATGIPAGATISSFQLSTLYHVNPTVPTPPVYAVLGVKIGSLFYSEQLDNTFPDTDYAFIADLTGVRVWTGSDFADGTFYVYLGEVNDSDETRQMAFDFLHLQVTYTAAVLTQRPLTDQGAALSTFISRGIRVTKRFSESAVTAGDSIVFSKGKGYPRDVTDRAVATPWVDTLTGKWGVPRTPLEMRVMSPESYPQKGALVTITVRGTGAPATVYDDATGLVAVTQPLVTDLNGNVAGWLNRGSYKARVTHPSFAPYDEAIESAPAQDHTMVSAWLAVGSVSPEMLAAGSITSDKIAAATVTGVALADGVVDASKVMAGTVDDAAISGFPADVLTGALSGQALQMIGSAVSWGSLRAVDVQEWHVAGSYTWTKPSGVTDVLAFATGAGGGGGPGDAAGHAGGGGGGGAAVWRHMRATDVSTTEAVTVGAGGSAAAIPGSLAEFWPNSAHWAVYSGAGFVNPTNVAADDGTFASGQPGSSAQVGTKYGYWGWTPSFRLAPTSRASSSSTRPGRTVSVRPV